MKHVAILDESARVLAVNAAWRAFAREHVPDNSRPEVGSSFLDACGTAAGGWSAHAESVARAIREIQAGDGGEFRCEYRSDGAEEGRWFLMQVSGVQSHGRLRLVVVYEDITEERSQERDLQERVEGLERRLHATSDALRLNEARLNALLQLFERSAELNEKEIIEFVLEQGVELTMSAIGYCHMVHSDQGTIELVAWSRATLANCDAVHEEHYPISEAGVWADCARIQAPVVHNDYPGLPGRKGLPEGHTELRRHVGVPVVDDGKVHLIMGVGNKAGEYDDSDVRQLQLLANDAWQVIRRKRAEAKLRLLAMTDALTGLSNRRRLYQRGEEEVRRVQRYGGSLSALLMDIDSFKAINDSYGHDVGDAVLKEFADTVRHTLRDVDMVGRIGGEEFAVLLPNTSLEEARALARRLTDAVRAMPLSADGSEFGITVSIGVATSTPETTTFAALVKAADVALYGAKEGGRDAVYG